MHISWALLLRPPLMVLIPLALQHRVGALSAPLSPITPLSKRHTRERLQSFFLRNYLKSFLGQLFKREPYIFSRVLAAKPPAHEKKRYLEGLRPSKPPFQTSF